MRESNGKTCLSKSRPHVTFFSCDKFEKHSKANLRADSDKQNKDYECERSVCISKLVRMILYRFWFFTVCSSSL